MSNFDSDSDSDSYIHQKTNVENWYTVYENEITVKLKMLTNEIVNDLDFSVPLNDYDSIKFEINYEFLDESILDINNLLKKFHKVKHIHFVGQAAWSRCACPLAAKPKPPANTVTRVEWFA